ncbi:MAG: hypothetical protein ABEI98_04710 [Halorhabdus sp.]
MTSESGDADRAEASEEAQFPTVPNGSLEAGGWSLRDTRVEVRARVAGFVVRAHERRYEDDQLRERVSAAGGPDHLWRLFYATRLTFRPPLPPAFGPAMALPKVRSAAREEFAEQLRAEGLTEIEQDEDERIEVKSGTQARVTRYDATLPVETDDGHREVSMDGWIGIWHDGAMLLAGGLYPSAPLSNVLDVDLDYDPTASCEELRSLIRHVEG